MKPLSGVVSFARHYSQRRVVVTGVGAVCPLGGDAAEAWGRLMAGEYGVIALEGDRYKGLPCRVAAKAPTLSGGGAPRVATSSTVYALAAAREALADAKWNPEGEKERQSTGVTFGVGMVDLNDVRVGVEALNNSYNKLSPYFVPRILHNTAAGQISIAHGFMGPNHTASTACATGAHSIGDAFRFIKHGDADVMVCGGAESNVDPLTVAGFCRLRALSTNFNTDPSRASRPFDKSRDGFVIGEGAAALVLEELEHARSRNVPVYAEILGYGLSGDASHPTAPREDGAGAVLCMRRSLMEAGVAPEQIGYVNAHATSTPLGDAIESKAISCIFKEAVPWVSSTKGAHGHLLGAAGALEAVFTVMACKRGVVPPTLNLSDISDVAPLNYVTVVGQTWKSASRRIALKNSFGFGGTNATLCIGEMA